MPNNPRPPSLLSSRRCRGMNARRVERSARELPARAALGLDRTPRVTDADGSDQAAADYEHAGDPNTPPEGIERGLVRGGHNRPRLARGDAGDGRSAEREPLGLRHGGVTPRGKRLSVQVAIER